MDKSLMTEFFKRKASLVGALFSQFVKEKENINACESSINQTMEEPMFCTTEVISPIKKMQVFKLQRVSPLPIQMKGALKNNLVKKPVKIPNKTVVLKNINELEIIQPKNEKHHPMVIFDGFQFRKDSNSNILFYSRKYPKQFKNLFKCACVNCNCKIVILENGFLTEGIHNFLISHESSIKYNSKRILNALMRKIIENSPTDTIKSILNKIVADENYIPDVYSDVQLLKKISRIKNELFKNVPKTIKEIDVESDYMKELLVTKGEVNGDYLIIITSKFLLETAQYYSKSAEVTFFCDGTFKSAPLLAQQMWTMHFSYMGYCFPFVFVLSEKRTSETYQFVFDYIKNNGIIVNNLMCDYEKSVEKAYKQVFGVESNLNGCLFHFCQSIFRKVQKIGLANQYYNLNSPIRKIIQEIFALPLVRKKDIVMFFYQIVKSNQANELQPLFTYFYYNYLVNQLIDGPNIEEQRTIHSNLKQILTKPKRVVENARFSIHWWNLFGSKEHTNNRCESFHSSFIQRFYRAHPNFINFVLELKQIITISKRKLIEMKSGVPPLISNKLRLKNRCIKRIWKQYESYRGMEVVEILSISAKDIYEIVKGKLMLNSIRYIEKNELDLVIYEMAEQNKNGNEEQFFSSEEEDSEKGVSDDSSQEKCSGNKKSGNEEESSSSEGTNPREEEESSEEEKSLEEIERCDEHSMEDHLEKRKIKGGAPPKKRVIGSSTRPRKDFNMERKRLVYMK